VFQETLVVVVDSLVGTEYTPPMATETHDVANTYDEAVALLAQWHGEDQDPSVDIYSYRDPQERVVRLLEVSDGFPASGEAWAVGFGPSSEFPYPSEVILLTPEEYQALLNEALPLPEKWVGLKSEKVWPRESE
jgi:hypothetical protein